MRVFVTGASGFVGRAVVRELLAAGHAVTGLARSEDSAAALIAAGAEAHRGDLTDRDSLISAANDADGVIHLAFIHDFSQYQANIDTDRAAVEAMLGALAGTGKPFVGTSGTLLLAPGRLATENDKSQKHGDANTRGDTEAIVTSAKGVRGSVVRLAPSVHGDGDHGFVPRMVDAARQHEFAAYIAEGANRWSAVHRDDAATLYRLALERGTAGAIYHGVAEEGVAIHDVATAIGDGLDVPVRSLTQEESGAFFGFLAMFAASDNPASSVITRDALRWQPTRPGLIADMGANYFG